MLIRIGQFEISECWDGVFYKKLADYPHITEWEMQTILDFISYEKANGRDCPIEAAKEIIVRIEDYAKEYEKGVRTAPPEKIRECVACSTYKGCMTDFVCHTSSAENALKILESGRLLSAVKARNMTAAKLAKEARNAANDPEDYFQYIMFSWGNCQSGDRLVTERRLGRFPSDNDLDADFVPGVRFFFRYDELIKHDNAVFEGVLPLKIKDELILKDWVYAIVIPDLYRELLEPYVSEDLRSRVHFISYNGMNIWEWSEFVYGYVKGLNK